MSPSTPQRSANAPQARGCRKLVELLECVRAAGGQHAVVAGVASAGKAEDSRRRKGECQSSAPQVVHHHAAPRHSAHLAQDANCVGRVEVVDQQRAMDDVRTLVREGQLAGIRLEHLYVTDSSQPARRVLEDLEPHVAGQDLEMPRPAMSREQSGEVTCPSAYIHDHRTLDPVQQRFDCSAAGVRAAGQAVEHRHFAQVAMQLDAVEGREIEVFPRAVARVQGGDHGAHRLRAQASSMRCGQPQARGGIWRAAGRVQRLARSRAIDRPASAVQPRPSSATGTRRGARMAVVASNTAAEMNATARPSRPNRAS